MNITAEQIIADLMVEIYKRDATIKELKIGNQELREKYELITEKHESECRQIAHYDNENGILRNALSMVFDAPTEPMVVLVVCDHHEEDCPEHPESESELRQRVREATKRIVSEQPEKPKKTYKDDFLEKLPNAKLYENRPDTCRNHCYGDVPELRCRNMESCTACWNEVMKDADD